MKREVYMRANVTSRSTAHDGETENLEKKENKGKCSAKYSTHQTEKRAQKQPTHLSKAGKTSGLDKEEKADVL